MKKIFTFFYILLITNTYSQIGINIDIPTEMLDVNGEAKVRIIDTINNVPTYVLSPDDKGVIQKIPSVLLRKDTGMSSDATRFLGGTTGVIIFSITNGTLDNSRLINNGGEYSMGTINYTTSSKGGIVFLEGEGYKISNPSNGVFDIKFDVPFTEIYGVSSNIIDNYISNNAVNPSKTAPGIRLNTKDNSQISFIDNYGFRVKTGDQSGQSSNRSFTFLVTGK